MEELVVAVFADRMEAYAQATAEALADPDPWNGFTGYIEEVCAMQAADRGFADILTMSFPGAQALEALRAQAYQGFLELIGRAKDSGQLRKDFTSRDLVLLLMANSRRTQRHRRRRPGRLASPRGVDDPVLPGPCARPATGPTGGRRAVRGHAPRQPRRQLPRDREAALSDRPVARR